MELPRIVKDLIDDHLSGVSDSGIDRAFLEAAAKEFYVATVAEAREMLRGYAVLTWSEKLDEYCARIGFLRASNALARHKMGKPWKQARIMNS